MISKRQLRGKAYKMIRKENKDHQEVYDELKQLKSNSPRLEVA